MLLPTPPSAVELERHTLTHVPYAPWCSTCVKSRGRDDAHRQLQHCRGPEVVHCDYTFFRTGDEEDRLTPILVAVVASSGYAYGGAALGKCAIADKALVSDMAAWLREVGLFGKIRIISDGEPAIVSVLKALA
eukprot:12071325-Heterocapsa_arctica.AAC.1